MRTGEHHPQFVVTHRVWIGAGGTRLERGIALHELTMQRASLEEAYRKLTDETVDYWASEVAS